MPQQTDPQVLIDTARAFFNVIDNVFTTYFDGRGGFLEQHRRLSPIMAQNAASLSVSLDDLPLIYGDGDPSAPEAKELVRSTQQAFLDRNKERGENHVFLANVCLVSIYQYWEDHYRKQIAQACGVPKGQIKLPIMGELRQIRRSIIHNKARALPEVETCTHFDFQADEPIEIDHAKMQELLFLIREDLVKLVGQLLSLAEECS